jgi:PPIC-type PPIASE domain
MVSLVWIPTIDAMRPRAFLTCVLLVGVVGTALAGCGDDDDLPSGVAAEVRGKPITEEAIEHAVVGRLAIKTSTKSAPAYWPADIKGCVEARTSRPSEAPSAADAKRDCERSHARHRIAALRLLIHGRWYQLEARKKGLRLPSTAAGARAAAKHAGVSVADMRDVAQAFDASDLLLLQDPPPLPRFTQAQIKRQYDQHRERYAPPPMRLIQALIMPSREQAQAVRAAFDSGTPWPAVLKRFGPQGTKPTTTGLTSTTTMQNASLVQAVNARDRGEAGIGKVPSGWYVFRVMRVVSSAEQQSLAQVSGRVEYDLTTRYQRRMRNRFNAKLRETYKSDTVCADRYRLADCS